ncbi:MAG: hypothetical protein R3B06_25575 [Kofleriaceae bacterium]
MVSVDDRRFWVLIGVTTDEVASADGAAASFDGSAGFLEPYKVTSHGALPAIGAHDFADVHWWALCPLAARKDDIARDRRYGAIAVEASTPFPLTVVCYVWPGKYFSRFDYRRVLDEICIEFGTSIEWDDSSRDVRPAYAFLYLAPPRYAERFALIESALRGCRHWRVNHGKDVDEQDEEASDEERLVAVWAQRSALLVGEAIKDLRGFLGTRPENGVHVTASVRRVSESHYNEAAELLTRACVLSDELSLLVFQSYRHRGAFRPTPAMQRDHRLRRLLEALAPRPEERWAAAETTISSTRAPLRATQIFEIWSTARLVAALVGLGWRVTERVLGRSRADGGFPVSHTVRFAREDNGVVLEFHYEPAIRVPVIDVGPAYLREGPGLESLSSRGAQDGIYSYGKSTPDFALQVTTCDGRRALAIGDATLADPERAQTIPKSLELLAYRARVAWWTNGRAVRCQEMNTFVVLPGPAGAWSALREAETDSTLFCLDSVARPDLELERRLSLFVERLISSAT